MKRGLAVVIAVAVAIALAGCGHRPPTSTPDIRGVVTSLSTGADGTASLRIVWDASLGGQLAYDAAQVSVTRSTRVYRATDGKVADAVLIASSELRVRDVVDAWFTGAARESYPVQVDARSIVVVGKWSESRALPVPPGLMMPD